MNDSSTLDRNTTALMVVDMQELESWKLRENKWNPFASRVARLLKIARQARLTIIHVLLQDKLASNQGPFQYTREDKILFSSDPQDSLPLQIRPVSECAPKYGEWMYFKTKSDAFQDENWVEKIGKSTRLNTIILAGVWLGDCVKQTAYGAKRHNFNVYLPCETTYDFGEQKTQKLEALKNDGMEITTVSKIIQMLRT